MRGVEIAQKVLRVPRTARNLRDMGRQSIAMVKIGCKNRPFYQIVVFPDRRFGRRHEGQAIEQLGSMDPIPNHRNEKLIAFNFERVRYWIGRDAHVSRPVLELLGLAGFLPLHPITFVRAKQSRRLQAELSAAVEEARHKPDQDQDSKDQEKTADLN